MSDIFTTEIVKKFINTPAPMWVYSQETLEFLEVNDAAIEKYGYSRDEFLKMNIRDIRPESEVIKLEMSLKTVALGERVDSGAWLHQDKSGKTFYMHLHGTSFNFEGSNARLVTAFDVDEKISVLLENKALEKDLYLHAQRIETIIESITDGFFAINGSLRFIFVNKPFENIFSCQRENVIYKDIWAVFPKEFADTFLKHYKKAIQKNQKVNVTDYYSQLGLWYSMSIYPSTEGASIYFKNITEQKILQNEVATERYNLSALINNTEDLIWSIDTNYKLISANEKFLNQTQVGQKRLEKGAHIFSYIFEQKVREKWRKYYERAFDGETYKIEELSEEFSFQARYFEISFNPIRNEYEEIIGIGCFARDITRRKKHDLILQKHSQINEKNGDHNGNEAVPQETAIPSNNSSSGILNLIAQFDFDNPGSGENQHLLNQLRSTTKQLEAIMNQSMNSNTLT